MLHPDGPAPRLGSCYFLLYPEVSRRSTFTYLASHQNPTDKGTYEAFEMMLAALLKEAYVSEFAVGEPNLTTPQLVERMRRLGEPIPNPAMKKPSRNLNNYIEAQVHGDISLKEDVEVLVVDPSFRGTLIGNVLEKISRKYLIDLYWHRGFRLEVNEVPMDFRGPSMPSLAKRIARHCRIDANLIGSAVRDLKAHPAAWSDRGSVPEVLQELKLLWHVLVRYGKPIKGSSTNSSP